MDNIFNYRPSKIYVESYPTRSDFPPTGAENTIYIDETTNEIYRWTGSEYVLIGQYPVVDTYADLPPAADNYGKIYVVATSTGVWPFNHPAGFYVSNGITWTQIPATAGAITYADLSATAPLTYDGAGGFSTEISSGVLVGRSAPGAGVMQEIGLANGLFLDGGNLGMLDITPRDVTATGTITGDNLSGTNTGDVTLDTAVSFIFLNPPSSQNIVINPVDLSLSSDATGILAAGRFPALTGDLTTSAGSLTTTLATVNSNVGSFGSSTQVPVFTVNGKGLITAVTNTTISGVSPGGSAGGDLSGTYPNPTVAKINGVALGSTTATSGNILLANGSAWVSSALSSNAVTSISGTSNQINASASVGAVTLSLSSTIVTPGTLAVNGALRSNSSTTLNATGPYNLSIRGTQTTDTGGTLPQAGILIESIFSSPNTLASAIGGISNISRFIAASARTLSLCAANYASVNCSGNVGTISILSHFYSDGFVAAGGTVSAAYGFYGKDPNTGTLAQAAYFDNLSVGYPSVDLKGTNKSIFLGNAGFGNNAPNGVLHATVPDAAFGNAASFILSTSANTYELRAGVNATSGYAWLGSTQRGVAAKPLYLYGTPGVGINVVPLSALDVNGGAAFGTYAGVSTPQSGGIIVSGNSGFGSTGSATYRIEAISSTSNLINLQMSDNNTGVANNTILRLVNSNNTNNNYTSIANINSGGGYGCAFEFINVNHNTTGTATGAIRVVTNTAGSIAEVARFAGTALSIGTTTTGPANGLLVSGNVVFGATSLIDGRFQVSSASSKTAGDGVTVAFITSSDVSPVGVKIGIVGNATATSQGFFIQASESGVSDNRVLSLQRYGGVLAIGGVDTTYKVTLTSGDIGIMTAGYGLRIKEGSNAKMGTATLVAGSSVVSNTSVTANSRIFLTSNADGGTPGFVRVSARTAGTSFTITSSNGADTSTVAWIIFEPS